MYYVILSLKDVNKPLIFSFSTENDADNFAANAQKSEEVILTITIDKEKFVTEVYSK